MSLTLLTDAGEYLISVELGSSSENFDLKSVSLLRNGKVVSTDEHSLLGEGGSSIYHLKLTDYKPGAKYEVHGEVIKCNCCKW